MVRAEKWAEIRGVHLVEARSIRQRLRERCEELGFAGSKTIFHDYVREVRPRYRPLRTYQRTVYRPGELCQLGLFEPKAPIPVGWGRSTNDRNCSRISAAFMTD